MAILALFWFVTQVDGERDWQTRFAAAWLVLPVLLVFIESRIGKTFWNPGYLIIVLPPFLFLAMAGLTSLPNRAAITGVMVVLVALSAINLHKVYVTPAASTTTEPSAPYLLAHTEPGDRGLLRQPEHGVDDRRGRLGRLVLRAAARQGAAGAGDTAQSAQ